MTMHDYDCCHALITYGTLVFSVCHAALHMQPLLTLFFLAQRCMYSTFRGQLRYAACMLAASCSCVHDAY